LTVTELGIVCAITFVVGLFLGLAIKSHFEERRKVEWNQLIKEEMNKPLNKPFKSGS
jgi:hypothetical protein